MKPCDRCEQPLFARGLCKRCYAAEWRKKHPEYQTRWRQHNRAKCREAGRRSRVKKNADPRSRVWEVRVKNGGKHALRQARASLSLAFLRRLRESTPNCPCCGVVLEYGGGRKGSAASLDKVVPDRGYVESNVDVLCVQCNLKKQDNTADDLRRLLAYVERRTAA